MIKWFLKRFNYTRELEDAVRENNREIATLDRGIDLFKKIIDDYRLEEEV